MELSNVFFSFSHGPSGTNPVYSPVARQSPPQSGNSAATSSEEKTQADSSDCLPSVLDFYEKRGIPDEHTSIMLQSWRPSIARQYKIYIKRWTSCCNQHSESPTTTCINKILDFFTHLYHENLSFIAIGTAKSAIASFVTCVSRWIAVFLCFSLIALVFPIFPF